MQEKRKPSDRNQSQADPVSALITKGLGGKANIRDVDCCATRLRITVKDAGKVNEDVLKQSGSRGIVKRSGVQIIYTTGDRDQGESGRLFGNSRG